MTTLRQSLGKRETVDRANVDALKAPISRMATIVPSSYRVGWLK